MSTKVWAVNKETDQVMNINQIDKSYKGKMVCLDENCGEELIICMGEKNKPYFRIKRIRSARVVALRPYCIA